MALQGAVKSVFSLGFSRVFAGSLSRANEGLHVLASSSDG